MQARLTFLSGPCRGRRVVPKDSLITIGGDRSHSVYLTTAPSTGELGRIVRGAEAYTIAASHPAAFLSLNGVDVGAGDKVALRVAT